MVSKILIVLGHPVFKYQYSSKGYSIKKCGGGNDHFGTGGTEEMTILVHGWGKKKTLS